MSDPYVTWPKALAELAQLIGREATLALVDHTGGLDRIYIAKSVREDHPWVAIIGLDNYARIVRAYGGGSLNLPRGAFLRLRKLEILELAAIGMSGRQIALRTKSTERYVRSVLSSWTQPADPRQQKLF